MYTVKSVMTQLTDPLIILQRVSDALRTVDPSFAEGEQKYLETVRTVEQTLEGSVTPGVREYINAKEKKIAAELVYVAWLGFQQNLDCFRNPINAMFLKTDYEDFHRERRMHTLLHVQEAMKTINAFNDTYRTLPEEKRSLTDGITEYVSYLYSP